MRRTPWRHPAFLGPPEEFLYIPLTAESMRNPPCAPDMAVGREHASAQTGPFLQAPSRHVDVPIERQPSPALCDLRHNEIRQVLAPQGFLNSAFQCLALDAAARRLPLQFAQFF